MSPAIDTLCCTFKARDLLTRCVTIHRLFDPQQSEESFVCSERYDVTGSQPATSAGES